MTMTKIFSNVSDDDLLPDEENEDQNIHLLDEDPDFLELKRITQQSKRDDPESYWRVLKQNYQNIKDESRNMYYFCILGEVGLGTFVKRFERFRIKPIIDYENYTLFKRWVFGHQPVLDRVYEYVDDLMLPEHFAYFMFLQSSPCNCYEIERDDNLEMTDMLSNSYSA